MKKKSNRYLLSLLKEFREARHAYFMFMPQHLSFVEMCIALYYEVTNHRSRDMYIIDRMILELVSKGILRANPVTYYTYELKDLTIHDVYLTTSDNSIFCHGTSLDISEAYAKAFGEVFERTSIRYNVDEGMLEVSERELREQGIPRVSLEHFPKPTELQKRRFDYMVFNEDTKFSWGKVMSMRESREYRIPAQTIFLSNFRTYPHEKMIIESSSHGAGAGYTKTQAITSGIHEIINRHFFLKSWYEGGIPKRILIDSLPEGSVVLHLAKNLEQRGFTIHLLDYSHEAGIPSVICILERYGGWSCGGTAGTSLEGAIQRSLLEAISTYLWYVEKMVKEGNTIHQKDISQVKSGFIDVEYGAAVPKVLLYNHEYYVQSTVYSKTMITGDFIPFSKECDTSVTYDARSHACKLFGDALYYQAHKEYLDEYDFFSVKVIIPNSYYFCLDEKDSRPVLNDTYPQNTEMNPFP